MSLSSTTIATGIAALSISGVTVKDITSIPEGISARALPVLFPAPSGWMGGGNGEPSTGPATFGTKSTRLWIFNRTYNYVYLHAPVGSGRGLYDHYSSMSGKADAILEALLTLDLSGVDVKNIVISDFGVLQDPAGEQYYGFTITIMLREMVNA
jgi:hypothetical protein